MVYRNTTTNCSRPLSDRLQKYLLKRPCISFSETNLQSQQHHPGLLSPVDDSVETWTNGSSRCILTCLIHSPSQLISLGQGTTTFSSKLQVAKSSASLITLMPP